MTHLTKIRPSESCSSATSKLIRPKASRPRFSKRVALVLGVCVATLLASLPFAGTLLAQIPEPYTTFYGTIRQDGLPVGRGILSVRLDYVDEAGDRIVQQAAIDQFELVNDAARVNAAPVPEASEFVLRIPMRFFSDPQLAEPIAEGQARAGQTCSEDLGSAGEPCNLAHIYYNDILLTTIPIGRRGVARRLELDLIVPPADLVLSKWANTEHPIAGRELLYTIEVTNQGPYSLARDVRVSDVLPPGLSYVQDTLGCGPALSDCALGDLAVGASARFSVLAFVAADIGCGTLITNTAEAREFDPTRVDPFPLNNIAVSELEVDCLSDLRVLAYGEPAGGVRVQEVLEYSIVVDNRGPSFGEGVTIHDLIQSTGSYDLIDIRSNRAATCVGTPGPDPTVAVPASAWPISEAPPESGVDPVTGQAGLNQPLDLRCTLDAPLPLLSNAGDQLPEGRWVLTLRIRSDLEQRVDSTATVSSDAPDPYAADNQAIVLHTIGEVTDLAVERSALGQVVTPGCPGVIVERADEATAGLELVHSLRVTNLGVVRAENVVLADYLPLGIDLLAAEPSQGSCILDTPESADDRMTCGLGTLEAGASAEVQVRVRLDPGLPEGLLLRSGAQVGADLFDPFNDNNFAERAATVRAAADLSIAKFGGAAPENRFFFLYDLENLGPSDAVGITVEDSLPEGLSFFEAQGGSCRSDPSDAMRLICQLDAIPAGGKASIMVLLDADLDLLLGDARSVTIQTVATVSSRVFDPCEANNMDDAEILIQRDADVYVRKSTHANPALAGEELVYQLMFGNRGLTGAIEVQLADSLPPGLRFARCASELPDTVVTCAPDPADPQRIRLQSVERAGTVEYSDGGALAAGAMLSVTLVAEVESGYVLDGRGETGAGQACETIALAAHYPAFAHNRAEIVAFSDADPRSPDNVSDLCTRIEGRADLGFAGAPSSGGLAIDAALPGAPPDAAASAEASTDVSTEPSTEPSAEASGPAAPDAVDYPVVGPGGTLSFAYTIVNNGPSDAAEVVFVDQLPGTGVVLDPATIQVSVSAGSLVSVGSDGRIEILVGQDQGQPGRLDSGSQVDIGIQVLVAQSAPCGTLLDNRVRVFTRAAGATPPFGTPTLEAADIDNQLSDPVRVECARVRVIKSVSFDGNCPGARGQVANHTGLEPTFCFLIENTGSTWLDAIEVTDTLQRRSGPEVIFTDLITYGADPNLPIAPGERVLRQVTVAPLTDDCGRVEDRVEVRALPVDAGRAPLAAFDVVTDDDTAAVVVPCGGADTRIQLPVLDTEDCETWIQIQNLGTVMTQAMVVIWGEAGACPPQAAGPLKIECTGLLRPGSAWSLPNSLLPLGSRSAVVYSLNAEDRVEDPQGLKVPFGQLACGALFDLIVGDHDQWFRFDQAYRFGEEYRGPVGANLRQVVLDFGAHQGQPLAVSVNRNCPDPFDPARRVNAAYNGISSDLEGAEDQQFGGYTSYAPMVLVERTGLNSLIYIHNSGLYCSSLEIWLKGQDNCLRPILGDILALAPGETATFDPSTVVGPDWLGSAWVRASQPIGLVVDTLGAEHFTSYSGVPGDLDTAGFSIGSQVNYAPLIYSEYQGWDTAIQVQNLSGVVPAKVKVYFLDRSGDVVTTLVDWICPRGSQTFFLPTIGALPGNWVGSARVESQDWWAPGTNPIDHPRVQTVLLLEKWSDPARSQRREAVAYNALTEQTAFDWQIGAGGGGRQSGSAVLGLTLLAKGNRGINSELAIANLVPKPGFTDFAIFLYDQNGLLDFVCQKLHDRQVEYIDLAAWGYVPPNFLGSAVVSATYWDHPVFDPSGGFARNLVGLGAVLVERIGGSLTQPDLPGDESKAFGGVPIFTQFLPQQPQCPGQPTAP